MYVIPIISKYYLIIRVKLCLILCQLTTVYIFFHMVSVEYESFSFGYSFDKSFNTFL